MQTFFKEGLKSKIKFQEIELNWAKPATSILGIFFPYSIDTNPFAFQGHFVISCKVQWGAYSIQSSRWVQEVAVHFQVFISMQQKREQLRSKKLTWYSLYLCRTSILLHRLSGPPHDISMRLKITAEKTDLWLVHFSPRYGSVSVKISIHAASPGLLLKCPCFTVFWQRGKLYEYPCCVWI